MSTDLFTEASAKVKAQAKVEVLLLDAVWESTIRTPYCLKPVTYNLLCHHALDIRDSRVYITQSKGGKIVLKIAIMKSSKISKKSEQQHSSNARHSQLGKAIIEGLKEILRGNVSVIRKENLKADISKLIE